MKIFVLEDDAARIMWFERRFAGHEVTYADSCAQIDRYQPPYDLICLDHDLGGRQLSEHEDDGEEFAKLICNPYQPRIATRAPLAVIVHNFNPEGATRIAQTMRALCDQVVVAPFGFGRFTQVLDLVLAQSLQ